MRCLGLYRITAYLAFALAVMPVQVAAGGQPSQAGTNESITAIVLDPSLRSALAVPTFQAAVEVADDRKWATAKLGFRFLPGWTGEAGFAAAFEHDETGSRSSSVRRLTDGSSFWGAATWLPSGTTRRTAPFLGVKAEISRDQFDYYDKALASHSDAHPSYSATAAGGVVLPHGALLAVNYRWVEAWQVDDGSRPCGAQGGAVVCPVDRIFQQPAPQPRQQLEAQVQAHLGEKVGAGVFVTRDFHDDVWGIEAPLYFIARRDSGFTGGLVLNYKGYYDRFDVSLFVGQVFRLK